MKKFLVLVAVAGSIILAQAQEALKSTNFGSNWSIGVDGGVATPLKHHSFFGSMRPMVGLHLQKQISPVFALGVEGAWGINTSSWGDVHSSTAIDNGYLGAYGAVNLFNLFGGYDCGQRCFDIEAEAGAGWGHTYVNSANGKDWNYFASKAGLNFNFHPSEAITLSFKPAIVWNMSDAGIEQTSAGYNANKATVNMMVGVTYNFGDGFECVRPYDQAEVNALNAQVNELRGAVDASAAALAASEAQSAALAEQLLACQNRPVPVQVVKEETNTLTSVRYVFFRIGSSVITADQMPNVEMIADYLKNHPESTVMVKGYASQDGNEEFNIKLAQSRAESVKNALVKKYGIKASRIKAQGEGIGHMFKEESWNRVSICTIDD